jgi:hypothetical protein
MAVPLSCGAEGEAMMTDITRFAARRGPSPICYMKE